MAQPTVSRFRRASLAVKIETTYGTDPILAATDIIFIQNVTFKVQQEQFRDQRIAGLLAELPDVPGARWAQITGEAIVRGAGVAYSATIKPEVDALLRAAGLAAAGSFVVSAEKWTYTPQSGSTIGESVTAALFAENAPQGKLLGAFATFRLQHRVGQPLIMPFTLSGMYVAPADVALITATPPTVIPPVFKSGAVTVDAVTHRISSLDFDLGNVVNPIQSANDVQAVAGFLIADRRIGMTLDPEQVTVATYDWHGKRDAPPNGGQGAAASWQVGTVQYNRIKLSAPRLQVVDIAEGNRGGLRIFNITAKLNAQAGGDEVSIVTD